METTNIVNATEEFLRSQITKLEEQLKSVQESHARVVQRDFSTAAALNAMSTSLHEWTMENLENGSITEEQAVELSEIGAFELTKEIEAEVTVTYYLTIEVPAGEDAESIINDIDFEAITYDVSTVTHVSASVDNIDI